MRSMLAFHSRRPASVKAPISRFSITVREGNTWRPSGTWAMPRCGRRAAGTVARSIPSNKMRPDLGARMPEMVLKRVVLPAPFGPTMETNWPASTETDTPRITGKSPSPALSASTFSIGGPLLAEVGLDDARMACHRLRAALHQHRAVVEHDEAIDQAHHGLHGVLDDDDGE